MHLHRKQHLQSEIFVVLAELVCFVSA
jgi:hypothetical protein